MTMKTNLQIFIERVRPFRDSLTSKEYSILLDAASDYAMAEYEEGKSFIKKLYDI